MTALVFALALSVAASGLVVALLALSATRQARRELRVARLALAAAEQHAADEAAGKDSALRLLGEERIMRRSEFETFEQQRAALRWAFDDALRQYRYALRLKDPTPPLRPH